MVPCTLILSTIRNKMDPFATTVHATEPSNGYDDTELGWENDVVYVFFKAHNMSNKPANDSCFGGLKQIKESGVVLSGYKPVKIDGDASANNILDYHSQLLSGVPDLYHRIPIA